MEMANLIGQEIFSNGQRNTQVFQATHNEVGVRLPLMSRSFISFSYGGKYIEDFNLIVTNKDRLERNIYSSFSDVTSSYDTFDGQLYWGSHIEPNQIELNLSTDGMTDNQLNDFKEWFAPGEIRELIFTEYPNRGIYARVASAPIMSVLPFEEQTSLNIRGVTYQTSTTIYKGDISLTFIMDEPYWHSLVTYMPAHINKETMTASAGDDSVESLLDKDMIKVMVEDGIPYINSFSNVEQNFFLGGEVIVTTEGAFVAPEGIDSSSNIATNRRRYAYVGKHLGISTVENSDGIAEIKNETPGYLFYAGTAKCYPWIKFTLDIDFNYNRYIITPGNKETRYSYIQIGNSKLEFTTPSILTAYNQAIKILNKTELDVTAKKDLIRITVNEYYARAWAMKILTGSSNDGANMRKMFEEFPSCTFYINSKTGEAIGTFKINMGTPESPDYIEIEENVGDMIRSNYLIIEGRDYLNSNGEIDINNCHQITTNETLKNVWVGYNNMYL